MKVLTCGCVFFLFFSCTKDFELLDKKIEEEIDFRGSECIGTIKNSPYQNLAYVEDFVPRVGDPCYDDSNKVTCSNRLYWFQSTDDCPKSYNYSSLKGLNKCEWTVWTGWHFWTPHAQGAYIPEAVQIKNGRLILKIMENPHYDSQKPQDCGVKNGNDKGVNCPYGYGGIYSKYFNDKHKGRSFYYGRIEAKAKLVKKGPKGAFLALWLWPEKIGKGYPYVASSKEVKSDSSETRVTGEIDIMESETLDYNRHTSFSYHNWYSPKDPELTKLKDDGTKATHAATSSELTFDMTKERIYGVEWSPKKIRWYVDSCVVAEIDNNTKAKWADLKGKQMHISDTASFLILNISSNKKFEDLSIKDELHIDYIKYYTEHSPH